MRIARGENGRMMRLILAAMMLLASLATARLQGEASARQVVYAGLGLSLCSGEHFTPADPQGTSVQHAHCAMCTLPFASDAPTLPYAAPAATISVAEFAPRTAVLHALQFSAPYQSRGPPLAG